MKRDVLERPFDSALVKTRKGNFGRELSYVPAKHYIERLNESFDGGWHFEVVLHEVLHDEVLVLGQLKAGGITKQAFGGSQITKNKTTGDILSVADDAKAAATDSLKKAASLFGVGLHLYGDDVHEAYHDQGGGNGHNGNGNGGGWEDPPHHPAHDHGTNGNGRLTAKQLSAIWAISRQLNVAQRDVRRRCLDLHNKQPEFLTKGEASSLIDGMKGGGNGRAT